MKVKVVIINKEESIQDKINKALENLENVIDIKYQIICNEIYDFCLAMIIYEEKE